MEAEMDKIKCELAALTLIFLLISFSGTAIAKEDAGKVLAVKNKAFIERDEKKLTAKVKQGILIQDTVSTMKASKIKMHFIDDSILTLGENSKVVIKEYVYSKDKGGKSIFNLLDGKMKSVVGKTKFEIHTPTAVAAARGTVILSEVGTLGGNQFATFICLEGEVEVASADPGIEGRRLLKPGMRITVFERMPLPEPIQLSPKSKGASSNKVEKLKEAKESKEAATTTEASERGSQAAAESSTESSQTSTGTTLSSSEQTQSSAELLQSLSSEIDSLNAATEMDYLEPSISSPEVKSSDFTNMDIAASAKTNSDAPPIEQQPGAKSSPVKVNVRFP